MGFKEGDKDNIVNPEVGWKGEPEGDGIDAHDKVWSGISMAISLLLVSFTNETKLQG